MNESCLSRRRHRRRGYTLLEIMIVVAIIGMLAIISLPAFIRARQAAQTTACVDKLRQIDGAKDRLAIESNMALGDAVALNDLDVYLKRPQQVYTEPTGGTIEPNNVGEDPECTNFDGLQHPATI